ncbi:MAG: DUF2937 family protein [Pseudomonadota bacterium]
MGILSKGWTTVFAAAGIAVFSQAPEFAQQYKQRLGGGIDELQKVVSQFDADAGESGLDRDSALLQMQRSDDSLVQLRGDSMFETIKRFENLTLQRERMNATPAVMQPIHLLRYPDRDLVAGAYEDYRPAVPLTVDGGMWAILGALLVGILGRIPITAFRMRSKRLARLEEQARLEAAEEARRLSALSADTPGTRHLAEFRKLVHPTRDQS